ncbi:hypothetical protein [Deinococcus marmoris]|uniref:hypothetical protein n=1 Tax=Deinococcus marmoris TaxID=249408 RepID=UPI0004965A12|nr:hypothetical protein [Deinococcus marmoris]
MTLLAFLLTPGLLAASALVAGHRRTAAALGVGTLGLAAWLWPAFLAWQVLHSGGRPSSFLMAHGLSAAALLLPVLAGAAVWGAWSLVSTLFTLPSQKPWLVLILVTHAASALTVILACAGLTALALPLVALWSLRPIAFIYLRLNLGASPLRAARPLPGPGPLGVGVPVLILTLALAVTASLWPRSGWASLNIVRVAELRQAALTDLVPRSASGP